MAILFLFFFLGCGTEDVYVQDMAEDTSCCTCYFVLCGSIIDGAILIQFSLNCLCMLFYVRPTLSPFGA